MTTRRYYANAAPQRTLASGITSSATSLAISGTFAGWPTQFPFFSALEYGTAQVEIISVTAITGTTATIVRGQGGTSAISHNAGSTLDHVAVAQDFDEANAHTVATTGVHGVASAVVGTTDAQTLTNKTLTAPVTNGGTSNSETLNTPTIAGGTAAQMLSTGIVGTAAVRAKAAATGRALETEASDGTVKFTVDGDTGNVATPGTLASGALTVTGNESVSGNHTVGGTSSVTGAATAASFTANGAGAIAGVVVPKTYTNEAAATAALPSPATGTTVYLTAPTGGSDAGVFLWNGTAWKRNAPKIQTGTGSVTLLAGDLTDTAAVTFPVAFGSTPSVVIVGNNSDAIFVQVNNPTVSGFTARAQNAYTSPPSINHTVNFTYIAVGQQ